jgi:CheY-like chemotaxis protein
MSESEKKILAVMNDLFFSVKIIDAAKKLGMKVEVLKDKAVVLERVKAQPAMVIFDLNYAAAEPLDLIQKIKADAATRGVNTIGFISHVQTEMRAKAQESGCDVVLARSAFAQNLPAILQNGAIRNSGVAD